MPRRADINELLRAIQAEAECAMRRANFAPHVERIHRLVDLIENRMRRQALARLWPEQPWLADDGRVAIERPGHAGRGVPPLMSKGGERDGLRKGG